MSGAVDQWVEWIESQPVQGWRIVTLEYPPWTRKEFWSAPIAQTMRELDQTFLKGSLRTQNKKSGAINLRRVVALGGDRSLGVPFHAHCLIDGIGDDGKFQERLRVAWTNNVRKFTDGPFDERVALTYSRRATNGVAEYIYYVVRHEGNDLKFGVDKIDVPNSYLTPSAS
ncbi:hypothetical protein [Burkholderia vietnamiensis]|uniref:hypothetical protein n=1 Tax=Burkholderia vietnamiensis TaxID=60552 RepID=UPI00264E0A76|nr:hypothetical protein [Burkholderia vietnamiensis]MDN7925254.1 hypothetical protein [Burkholderia vietnamiensis]